MGVGLQNRDLIFLRKFWKTVFQLGSTKLRMSAAYHPQTGGQKEVLDRRLQHYLRSFVYEKAFDWIKFLH